MTSYSDTIIFWEWVLLFTALSGLGSLFIIVSILLKLRKDFSARLVLYLSVADFFLSFICLALCAFNLSNGDIQNQNQFACELQPVATWYFMEASILWLTVISINSYKVVFYNNPLSFKQEIIANIICWGLPVITTILPLISGTNEWYGPRNGLWCSFAEDQKMSQLINILVYYIPCLIVILTCYIRIAWTIFNFGKKKITNNLSGKISIIRRLFFFVLAYFIVWTPLVLSYIYEAATGTYINFTAEFIVDNLLHVQGILNFILYGLNQELIKSLWNRIFKIRNSFQKEGFAFSEKDEVEDIDV